METTLPPPVDRIRRRALIVGGVALGLCVVLSFTNPAQFFRSYLLAYAFCIGFPLGCLAILMLYHLVGGAWGAVIRPALEAAVRTLPLMLLLFLPLAFGIRSLYEWADPHHTAHDEILQHKAPYLNVPFFLLRTGVYFIIWIGLGTLLNRWSRGQERTGDASSHRHLQAISGPGLVLYALTATFAAFDWLMSLEPHWHSTIYGMLFIAGQGLSAFAFVIGLLAILSRSRPLSGVIRADHFHDLGNLTLAFVMLWAYMAFSQFLIIWSGNLPEETPWYLRRINGGWGVVAIALIILHFALPFVLLLSRRIKRLPSLLLWVVSLILVMRLVDIFWLSAPAFHGHGLRIHWMDIAAPVGITGIWLSVFLWQLGRRPLLLIESREPGGVTPAHAI